MKQRSVHSRLVSVLAIGALSLGIPALARDQLGGSHLSGYVTIGSVFFGLSHGHRGFHGHGHGYRPHPGYQNGYYQGYCQGYQKGFQQGYDYGRYNPYTAYPPYQGVRKFYLHRGLYR
jgi:hypothetical protein